MSFYGNVFYELTNSFMSFFVHNNGYDKLDFITIAEDSPVEITAIGLGGKFHLNSGNRWINLEGKPLEQSCAIYHGMPDTENTTQVIPFEVVETVPEGVDVNILPPGQCIGVPIFYYDLAGHIAQQDDIVYYQLPANETELDVEALKKDMELIKDLLNITPGEDEEGDEEGFTNIIEDFALRIQQLEDYKTTYEDAVSYIGYPPDLTDKQDPNLMNIIKAIGKIDNLNQLAGSNLTDALNTTFKAASASMLQTNTNFQDIEDTFSALLTKLHAEGILVDTNVNDIWNKTNVI